MSKLQKKILRLELAGAVFIILLGSMLYFNFEMSVGTRLSESSPPSTKASGSI
ncbi:MAG: hypothetical protein QW797_06625 [Thermoproteota archaeon]